MIFSKYIVSCSPEDIKISASVRSSITKNINPPFEELFDEAEESVLMILLDPWKTMLQNDKDAYNRVRL